MADSTSSSNNNYPRNFTANSNSQTPHIDIDSSDNETTANNIINRNDVRDHLFQAMFSRIALTYDRTFPPFARRFIEFMLLLTAISVLVILIYIHMAFVKAPITCLDHFATGGETDGGAEGAGGSNENPVKHMVIRVEVLSDPPVKYGLYQSYGKEYDDLNRLDSNASQTDRSSSDQSMHSTGSLRPSQLSLFIDIIRRQCQHDNGTASMVSVSAGTSADVDATTDAGTANSDNEDKDTKKDNREGGSYFSQLFNFPINPILEKAEYWREKLSVRAMAPFRQTFNELELFAKSVFTEEKYIMEYSMEYGLLRLTPQTRERLHIPVHFVLLDSSKDKCFGNAFSRFLLQEFVGYDQIIIGSLKRLAERQNGKGYVRNVVSGEHYRFVNSWMSRTSYLAAGFIMIIFTLSVSMLLRYSHHQIFVFIVDLLRMLENNLQFSFPAAPLLTVVLALVGMEAIMSEFFNDTSTAFYTILIIWLADQYEAVCCRTYVSKRHWPKYFYLYHFAFYAYHYRFNGQFSGLALLCSWLFIQHSMFFFFHHYELPRLMHGIAVRAIMDNLIVERAENSSLTPTSMFPNDNDDNDRSDGDRYDTDEGPGPSNVQGPAAASGESREGSDNRYNGDSGDDKQKDNEERRQNGQPGHNNNNNNSCSHRLVLSPLDNRERNAEWRAAPIDRNQQLGIVPATRADITNVSEIAALIVVCLKAVVDVVRNRHSRHNNNNNNDNDNNDDEDDDDGGSRTRCRSIVKIRKKANRRSQRKSRTERNQPHAHLYRHPPVPPVSLDALHRPAGEVPAATTISRSSSVFTETAIASPSQPDSPHFLRHDSLIPLFDLVADIMQDTRFTAGVDHKERGPHCQDALMTTTTTTTPDESDDDGSDHYQHCHYTDTDTDTTTTTTTTPLIL